MIKDEITYPDIQKVLDNGDLSKSQKISKLEVLLNVERQLQRAGTESNMNHDDGTNSRLRHLELALDAMGSDACAPEDNCAATL